MFFDKIFDNVNFEFEYKYDKDSLLILGNAMQVLRKISSDSIDLIFADPPYGIGKDFGNDTDIFHSSNDYFIWAKEWIDECMRVLKDDGTMYFMSSTQNMPRLDVYVDEKYNVVNRIIWSYDSSGVQSKKKIWLTIWTYNYDY